MLTYKGSALIRDPTNHIWQVFMTEYAALVAPELMYQVESAGRLHWLPEKLCDGIRRIGCGVVMGGNDQYTRKLRSLLDEIAFIRWDKAPPQNCVLPQYAGYVTPLYVNGDWVSFNKKMWTTDLGDEIYLREEEFVPLGGRVPRIQRLTGHLDLAAERQRETMLTLAVGFEIRVPSEDLTPTLAMSLVQAAPVAVPSVNNQRRAKRTLWRVVDHRGVADLRKECGLEPEPTMESCIAYLESSLREKEKRMSQESRDDGVVGGPSTASGVGTASPSRAAPVIQVGGHRSDQCMSAPLKTPPSSVVPASPASSLQSTGLWLDLPSSAGGASVTRGPVIGPLSRQQAAAAAVATAREAAAGLADFQNSQPRDE